MRLNMVFYVAIPVIAAVVVGYWTQRNAERAPLAESPGTGAITPGKYSAIAVVAFAIWLAVVGVIGWIEGYSPDGLLLTALFGSIALFMSPSLTHLHDLHWDKEGVTGSCQLFGPSLGLRRTIILWDEIERSGKTITGYWYIQSHDGRRIYWSYLYPGYGKFVRVLRSKRQDLALPQDLGG